MIHSRNLPFLTTLTIFVVAYLLCVLQYPAIFSTRVIGNLLTDNAFLGIAAVGMTFVILSGASTFRSVRSSHSPAFSWRSWWAPIISTPCWPSRSCSLSRRCSDA